MQVLAFGIAEHLNVFEHALFGSIARWVCTPPVPSLFQKIEEAFGYGVVMAVPAMAHAGFQIVLAKKCLPLTAGELRSLDALLSVKQRSEPDLSVCGDAR